MKFNKILCLGFSGSEFDESLRSEIDNLTSSRIIVSNEDLVAQQHPETDVLLVKLGAKVGKELMDACPNLKYIGMFGTGFGGIDTQYATSRDITVTNIADYATQGVAEFTFGIILEFLRDISKAKVNAQNGNYSDVDFSGSEIKGKTFGIIGLGNIGKRTAELAKAFGANVIFWSKSDKPEVTNLGVKYASVEDLLKEADILTLNISLNKETENFLNADRMALIKPNAIVVNPSPMELVNFEALVTRLQQKTLTFILDHSDEMSAEDLAVLAKFDNCIIYPPIAYLTKEASSLKKKIFIDNLKNYLEGTPSNKVN